jgi:hypothetical protein
VSACKCDSLPEIFFLDSAPGDWLSGLNEQFSGDWKILYHCPRCGQMFSVDIWDKYQEQVVVRITNPKCWEQEADSVALRKTLLLRNRGGTEERLCIWAGCEKRRVQGMAYCLDHLWETGVRR